MITSEMITSDIYKISDTVNQIQKKNIPIEDNTLFIQLFGYLNEMFGNQIQNTVIHTTESSNEFYPIRTKYEKNILTHAVTYNVPDINAVPAKMNVMIGIIDKELQSRLNGNNEFIIDRNCPIIIDNNYEYHLDYDILIKKVNLPNGGYIYTATYIMDFINKISDITNPYLDAPIQMSIENNDFVFIKCTLRQVQESIVYKKIISNNILENKTIDFEFDDQLACFDVIVNDNGTETLINPIFEGMPLNNNTKYCYYTFLNANTIRIKFDRKSYQPATNNEIQILLKCTKGEEGNFIYKDSFFLTLKSSRIDYNNLSIYIMPITDSTNGINRKSKSELQEIIPKRILARGNITCDKDLENYFNSIDNSKLYVYPKIANQNEVLKFAYMILKDSSNNIIPTNTINLKINQSEFSMSDDGRYIFSSDKLLKYNDSTELCTIDNDTSIDNIKEREKSEFLYTTPFTCIINNNPLSTSYYLTNVDNLYYLKFSYINTKCNIQFISTSINVNRMNIDSNDYILNMNMTQNISLDSNLITMDENNNIVDSKIAPILYIDNGKKQYYVKGDIIGFDKSTFKYNVQFKLNSDGIINKNGHININNIYSCGSGSKTHAYIDESVPMGIYLFAKFDQEYGRNGTDIIFPNMDGYSLCNIYNIEENVDLFYNYSNIINTMVEVEDADLTNKTYTSSDRIYKKEDPYTLNIDDYNKNEDGLLIFEDKKIINDYNVNDYGMISNINHRWDMRNKIMYFDCIIFKTMKTRFLSSILQQDSNMININISDFDRSKDSILVFINDELITNYTISSDNKYIINSTGNWIKDTKINIFFMDNINIETQSTKIENNTNIVNIGINNLSQNDKILVFENGKFINNYTITSDKLSIIKLDENWIASQDNPIIFTFVVYRDSNIIIEDKQLDINTSIDKLTIGSSDFNRYKDSLLVFQNNKLIDNYTISSDNKYIINTNSRWDYTTPSQQFNYLIFKNINIEYYTHLLIDKTDNIDINISDFDRSKDTLLVFKDNELLYNYIISNDNSRIINLNGLWDGSETNIKFSFILLRNLVSYTQYTTLDEETNKINIDISDFDRTQDTLLVFKDNQLLSNYTISSDNKYIINSLGKWNGVNNNSLFTFIVIKNIITNNINSILTKVIYKTIEKIDKIPIQEAFDKELDNILLFKNSLLNTNFDIINNNLCNTDDSWLLGEELLYFDYIILRNLKMLYSTITITNPINTLNIGIGEYDNSTDSVLLFKNGTIYTNYIIENKTMKFNTTCEASIINKEKFDIYVLKNTKIIYKDYLINSKINYVDIQDFDKYTDTIIVFKNSVLYNDYTIDYLNSQIIINDEWDGADINITCIILKNVINTKSVIRNNKYNFTIYGLPVVRYSYLNNTNRFKYLLDYLRYRKYFIDNALEVLEHPFGIDLKFFNTYGRSKIFTIGHNGDMLDKVNLSLTFKVKLKSTADKNIQDYIIQYIKSYIEDINNKVSFVHMNNLTNEVKTKFTNDIDFIEFVGINDYNALYQYIEKQSTKDVSIVPEFLNINLLNNQSPDINIVIL